MKSLYILFSILATISLLYGADLTDAVKKEFTEVYRSTINLREEFPDNLEIDVIFTDLNSDGKLDAIATSIGEKYQNDWHWLAFLRGENGDWLLTPQAEEPTEQTEISAGPDEFYKHTDVNGITRVVILKKGWPEGSDGEEPPIVFTATRIKIAKDGSVILEEMERPTNEQLAEYEKLTCEKIGE